MESVILNDISLLLAFGIAYVFVLVASFSKNNEGLKYSFSIVLFSISFVYAILKGVGLIELSTVSILFAIPLLLTFKGGKVNEL